MKLGEARRLPQTPSIHPAIELRGSIAPETRAPKTGSSGALAEDPLEGVEAERLLDHELHRLTGLRGGEVVVPGDDGDAHERPPPADGLDEIPAAQPWHHQIREHQIDRALGFQQIGSA